MAHESRRYCPYLCELATCGEPTRTLSHRTQNPVVREHRVGSSPTSGTGRIPANRHYVSSHEEKPRHSRRGRLLQPYYHTVRLMLCQTWQTSPGTSRPMCAVGFAAHDALDTRHALDSGYQEVPGAEPHDLRDPKRGG